MSNLMEYLLDIAAKINCIVCVRDSVNYQTLKLDLDSHKKTLIKKNESVFFNDYVILRSKNH